MRNRSAVVAEALASAGGSPPALRRPLMPGEAPPNPAPAGSAGLGLARAAEQDPTIHLAEKVRTAVLAGRVSFLPYLDPYTEETPAMRRAYTVMLRNAVVKQALHHKICSVASLDLQVTPAGESDRDHEVADFTRYCYEDAMEGGLLGMAEELLQPVLIVKSVLAEKVWYPDLWERGKFTGKRFYRAFKSKEYAEPLYDEFRNFVGVRATGFGQAEVFPASDFVFLKNWPLFGGPGMSDLRAAWGALWQLDTIEKLHLIHLERYLSPVMSATYDDAFNKADLPKLQADLAAVRARGWLTVPEHVKVVAMQMAMRGEAEYLEKCKDLREQIALSITGAYLQMLTATPQGEIRGNSETHRSTAELLVWELAARLVGALNTQATPQLVQLNYAGADYPKASLGGVNYQELKASIEIDTAAQKMGVPLSLKATARKYSLQVATDPADTLKPAPPGGLGGFGGGMPFADPPQPRPGAPAGAAGATEGQEFTDGEGNTWRFCGGPGGKPGPCPQGKGKPTPKGRKAAAASIPAAPSATHADPMHGHPFAGKSREEMVATLTKQSDPQTAPDNPRGYDTTRYPAGVDGPRFVASVTSMVGKAQAANPFQRPTLPAVYEAAKAAQPGLTLAAFQGAIVKAAKDGAIELGAFTQAKSELPHPEHAIPLHRETLYYVRVPDQRFADAEEFCGGPGSGRPGPCPTGRADEPAGGKRDAMVARVKEGKIPFPIEKRPYKYNFSAFHDAQPDRSIPVVMLEPENLVATQDWTVGSKAEAIKGELRQDRPILVIRHGGKDYIEEGHHRSIHALVTGQKVPAKILEQGPDGKYVPAKQTFADPSPTAIAGPDGARAEQLLTKAQAHGTAVLGTLAARAVGRLLAGGDPQRALQAGRLFTPGERRVLAGALASALAPAELLGRARIARRAHQVAERHADGSAETAQRFSDEPTDLRCFDETGPLAPMAPAEAVSYFRKLVPGLTVDAAALAAATGRQAFSLAVTTDATLLAKVQGIIAGRLESGEDVRGAADEVQALLDQAGVTVSNPAYAEMVIRTNLMDAFTEGSQRELAGHTETFPVCRYLNPDDGRSRPEHAARSGRYYDSGTAFADVRGRDIADAANCRCNFAAVDKWEWAELQAAGERIDL